jgi:chromosome segregation ATPase
MRELKENYARLKENYKDSVKTIREYGLCIDVHQKEIANLEETLFKASEHAGFMETKLKESEARCKMLDKALDTIDWNIRGLQNESVISMELLVRLMKIISDAIAESQTAKTDAEG